MSGENSSKGNKIRSKRRREEEKRREEKRREEKRKDVMQHMTVLIQYSDDGTDSETG